MKEIPLSQDKVALVDDDDYELVSSFKWSLMTTPHNSYAYRKEDQRTIYLHRYIMNVTEAEEVDHIDKNGLNDQRHNMRVATRTENARYRVVPQTENGSGYRGVRLHGSRWQAKIQIAPGVRISLGTFETPEEAARAYDAAAKEHHGEFAVLNFP